jgi:DnaK suppressor protein
MEIGFTRFLMMSKDDSESGTDEPRSDKQGAENMNKRKDAVLKLREVLIRRRDALRKALAGDLSSLKELRAQSGGDAADFALDSSQDEISSQLAEVESRELAQIENALERMRNGVYGICEVTGRPIPLARLQALPYATMCIEAQREAEKQGRYGRSAGDWSRVKEMDADDNDVALNDLEIDVS